MKSSSKNSVLALVEGALMVALAFVLDRLPFMPKWPLGGSVTVAMVPLVYYSYRRGTLWGIAAAFVNSLIQIVMGWYAPPAGTFIAFVGCVLLDYVLAYGVLGIAGLIAKPFGKHRYIGYIVGAFSVCMLRYLCSFLSGILLWGDYAPEGQAVWYYSMTYNGGYMIPNAILTAAIIAVLCLSVDPLTLRTMKRFKHEKA